ncbi:HeH/LEM domain-containing protein [Pasteurella multocida]|uniref:HeH/LEM domain-containing protein n=1 Tax=Pasteurella multocida TaxID=747 RepID=UPI000DA2EAA9|nr:HeH/LEM domain-containing protein [Pasteurella multocida]WRK02043.1 HeH/LEM domain-containing protein [Pasteurella multocida]SQI48210.1 HeH/LEM domain [Pasteurella multocida]SUB38290.1 HeH/LEM domain [Pasteurella multocida]HDR0635839.1 hypothetical protein [Pasteurella multocida]
MGLAAFNRMRRLQAEQKAAEEKQDDVDNSKLKVEEIKTKLADMGVEFDKSLKKPELLELLAKAEGEQKQSEDTDNGQE